jgi:hypothetical protein
MLDLHSYQPGDNASSGVDGVREASPVPGAREVATIRKGTLRGATEDVACYQDRDAGLSVSLAGSPLAFAPAPDGPQCWDVGYRLRELRAEFEVRIVVRPQLPSSHAARSQSAEHAARTALRAYAAIRIPAPGELRVQMVTANELGADAAAAATLRGHYNSHAAAMREECMVLVCGQQLALVSARMPAADSATREFRLAAKILWGSIRFNHAALRAVPNIWPFAPDLLVALKPQMSARGLVASAEFAALLVMPEACRPAFSQALDWLDAQLTAPWTQLLDAERARAWQYLYTAHTGEAYRERLAQAFRSVATHHQLSALVAVLRTGARRAWHRAAEDTGPMSLTDLGSALADPPSSGF